MSARTLRLARIAAVSLGVLAILALRFSAGIWPENEVTGVVHWGMLPIALMLGLAAWVFEVSGGTTPLRRDALWGLAAAILVFALLRLVGAL